jgi:hypothetical protein
VVDGFDDFRFPCVASAGLEAGNSFDVDEIMGRDDLFGASPTHHALDSVDVSVDRASCHA